MNTRKIIRFILISFGISWLVALFIYVFRIPFGSLSSNVLVAMLYMTAPALAAIIVQKGIYKQSLKVYGLTISSIPSGKLLMVPAIFIVFLAIFLGIVVVGSQLSSNFAEIIFSKEHLVSLSKELVPGKLNSNGLRIPDSPYLLFVMIIVSAIFAGFSLNLPVTLGEELGWRGLLAEELRPLGYWKSNLLIGLIWGIWYAPIVLMGFNFPAHPW
jgi:membrane protease YdiL (CAAX protease family)